MAPRRSAAPSAMKTLLGTTSKNESVGIVTRRWHLWSRLVARRRQRPDPRQDTNSTRTFALALALASRECAHVSCNVQGGDAGRPRPGKDGVWRERARQ